MTRQKTGKEGEAFSIKYLKKKGYQIIHSNYNTPIGEIDIIAKDGDAIVFIEVKTRRSLYFGYPYEAVTYKKRRKLEKLALYYLKANKMADVAVRFDVIGLYQKEGNYQVEHIVDAFEV